jgi:signal transduction histidine kinase
MIFKSRLFSNALWWMFVWLLYGVVWPAWASNEVIESLQLGDDQPNRVAIWRAMQTLPDEHGLLDAEQAGRAFASQNLAGQSQRLPSIDYAYGRWIPYPYWAMFTLQNPSGLPKQWVLSFESPTQDDARLWKGQLVHQQQSWQPVPEIGTASSSFGTGQLFPAWRVTLEPQQAQSFMVRIEGHNLMRFPIYAMRDEAFTLQQRWLHLGIGFFMAIPLVVMLFVLTLIRSARDKSIPLFLIMALAELVGASWVSGFMHASLPWLSRALCGWTGLGGYALLLGLSCIHAQIFLHTKKQAAAAHHILSLLAAAWLLALPLYAYLHPEAARLCLLFGGTAHAFFLLYFAAQAYRKETYRQSMGQADEGAKTYLGLFVAVWAIYLTSGAFYLCYRIFALPVYLSLVVNFVQGSVVASLLGCAVSVQVIRRRNQLQKTAQRALDRNQLFTAAHHDLWQPIQSIGLHVTALEKLQGLNPEQAQRYQRNIQSAVTHVHNFVDDLRHEERPARFEDVDLNTLLEPLIDEYRLLATQKHISLRVHPAHRVFHTDAILLHRIVRNLLSNAIRYTNPGGRVIMGLRRAKGQCWLMVYDNGIGMSPEQTQSCFEFFSRFGDITRVPEGMGIGLFSVKRIAQQMNLPVRLASQLHHGTAIGVGLIPTPSDSH